MCYLSFKKEQQFIALNTAEWLIIAYNDPPLKRYKNSVWIS